MYFYPDPVVNIVEDVSERTETTLGIQWEDGADPGGTPVIDYRVTVSSSDGLYNSVVTVGLEKHYVATGLSMGVVYYF
jgi:hypothetical protein